MLRVVGWRASVVVALAGWMAAAPVALRVTDAKTVTLRALSVFDFHVLAAQGRTSLLHEAAFEAELTNGGMYRYIRAAKTADESFFVTELHVLGQR
ncbi:MAG: hypothetical protein ACFLMY_04555 [Candidatus Brachytrichaceae bacterium NZ_4S206]